MSKTIDQRVVEMTFDNSRFERNVQTSMNTLDKLNKSLNLTGASKGLENVNAAARNFNMSGMDNAIETVHAKFSALQVMGITALANITNSAVNAEKRITSALTIEPIKTGFQEYETQINAVQTILANTESKGSTLKDVNKALDELNTYADKTIYNFTEMTRNIGTFTAAGVDLDKSVTSIKGIANLAAVSGSTSQQASTAMYQLSQALAAGKVQLMDWNSVVNAGMGGQVFQDALKRTAKQMGYNVDEMIKKYGSFRESLTKGEWLTSEVLTETLTQLSGAYSKADLIQQGYTEKQATEITKLANTAVNAATKVKTFRQLWDTLKEAAQSGWTQSWEIIVGDFEEAKKLLTKVSYTVGAMISASAESRNNLLQGWKDKGGRTAIIDAISNSFKAIISVIKPVKEAFREVFPPATSKQLADLSKNLRDFTAKLILSGEQSKQLKSTFKGLFSLLDIGITFVKEVASGIARLLPNVSGLSDGVLKNASSFGEWASNLRDTIKETDIFGTAIDKIVGFLQKVIDKVKQAINKLKEFKDFLKEKISFPSFESFLQLVENIWAVTMKVGSKIKGIASKIGEALGSAFRSGDVGNALDVVNGGILAALLLSVNNVVKNLSGSLSSVTGTVKGFSGILNSIKGILNGVRESLEAWQQNLKAGTLLKIAAAIGILAVSLLLIATIKPEKLATSMAAITAMFGDLLGSMAIFNKIDGSYSDATKAVMTMIAISVSVLILASALKKVSSLGYEELGRGLIGITALTTIIVAAAKVMGSDSKKIQKGAMQMVIMAAALKILASVCKDLSSLSWEEMRKGLVGVGALMAEISLFLNNTKMSAKSIITATGIVILAASMKILASVCKDFAGMSWEEIGKGLASIGALLLEITAFTNLNSNATQLISTGISLIAIAAAMKIMASVMSEFAGMSQEDIAKGLLAMGSALLEIVIAVTLMPDNMISIGAGLLIVSSAIVILSNALNSMGSMSWEDIAKGLAALAGSMLILALGLNAMNGTLAGSAALLVASAALVVLSSALNSMGSMSWEEIGKSLLVLAGAFVVLGIAGYALAPVTPAILALGAAVALVGVGCLTAGIGINLLAVGIAALAAALAGGVTAIAGSLAILITTVASLIPTITAKIGEGIVAFVVAIGNRSAAIIEAVEKILMALLSLIEKLVPKIVIVIVKLITALLKTISEYLPEILEYGIRILLTLLKGIRDHISEIISVAIQIVLNFIEGISSQLGAIVDAAFKLIISFINALSTAIDNNTKKLISAVKKLFKSIIRAAVLVLTGGLVDIKGMGGKIMNSGFVKGIKEKISSATSAFKDIVKKCVNAVKEKISSFVSVGEDVVTGLVNGIKNNVSKVISAGTSLGKKALDAAKKALDSHSPSKKFVKLGEDSDSGLVIGLNNFSKKVEKTAQTVSVKALNTMRKTLSGIADVIDSDIDSQPTIRPVIDLSNVKTGADAIDNMLNKQSVGVSANVDAISSMMNQNLQNGGNAEVVSAINKLRKDLGNIGNTTYQVNGVTYDDGSNISDAVKSLVRAARIERRI